VPRQATLFWYWSKLGPRTWGRSRIRVRRGLR